MREELRMFTGIIENKGKVLRLEYRGLGKRLVLELPQDLTDVQLGDSININGVCLTVTDKSGQAIEVDLSSETVQKTAMEDLKEGDFVNLERALKLTDRLGGHIVTGHVDGIGVIVEKRRETNSIHLKIKIPKAISRYIVQKGAIAIDGISLTVNECQDEEIQMALIPFTIEKTTLITKRVGDRVNVEADILGKYVEKMLDPGGKKSKEMDFSFLKEHGFIREE
jgi:riboflavin synthase